ncbi:MAG: hypothetical protein Q9M94_05585 [Candidatus Gracilibacteria bacterium]|nr:hypothetical protein [Candidatus Gracilibacteria bacterium]
MSIHYTKADPDGERIRKQFDDLNKVTSGEEKKYTPNEIKEYRIILIFFYI